MLTSSDGVEEFKNIIIADALVYSFAIVRWSDWGLAVFY